MSAFSFGVVRERSSELNIYNRMTEWKSNDEEWMHNLSYAGSKLDRIREYNCSRIYDKCVYVGQCHVQG